LINSCDKITCPVYIDYTQYNFITEFDKTKQLNFDLVRLAGSLNSIIDCLDNTLKDFQIMKQFIYESQYSCLNLKSFQKINIIDNSYKDFIKVANTYIPLECMLCSNLKKIDIEKEIIVDNAKIALSN